MPSNTSVETIRSFGTISRYSPWNATSAPSLAVIAERQRPPTRRSISATVSSPWFPAHHRFTSSGVVYTWNTSRAGASNSRVMRICVSDGVVTAAVCVVPVVIVRLLPPAA
jgi:hypothetical protein